MSLNLSLINVAMAAQDNSATFGRVLNPIIDNILLPLVQLVFAIALLVFIYGVAQMIIHKADADANKQGKASVLWGIAGMFIMVTAWGIIHLVSNTVKEFN